jgi:hypothetical protein
MSRDRHACRSVDEQPQQFVKRHDHLPHNDVMLPHRVFLRDTKLTANSPCPHHGPPSIEPKVRNSVPQQDARKNYIGIVSDATEEERIADTAVRAQPHIMSYLVGCLAAALRRPRKGAPGRTTTS